MGYTQRTIAACGLVLGLAACGGEPGASDQSASGVLEAAFVLEGGSEADMTPLVNALPDQTNLTWQSKRYDASSGATVFEGLRLSWGEEAPIGVLFDEAQVWGLDTDFLVDRLNGQRLDESGPLFARFDGKGLTYFGIVEASELYLPRLFSPLQEPTPVEVEFGINTFEASTERMVIDNLELRPWSLSPVTAETLGLDIEDEDEAALAVSLIQAGQAFIAFNSAIAYDRAIASGLKGTYSIEQTGADISGEWTAALYDYQGVKGFDVDKGIARDTTFSQTVDFKEVVIDGDVPTPNPFGEGFSYSQTGSAAFSQVENLRLDKIAGYLTRGEMPEPEVRDLMGLGLWTTEGYRVDLNDRPLISLERSALDLQSFEWLIPTDVSLDIDTLAIELEEILVVAQGFMELALAAAEDGVDDMDEGEAGEAELILEGLSKAIDLMPEYGLDQVRVDFDASAVWDAETGTSSFDWAFMADGFGDSLFNIELDFPTYAQGLSAYRSDDREEEFETIIEEAFRFHGLTFTERDRGGFDKILGFAHEIGEAYADQPWGAILSANEPDQLRSYLATTVRFASGSIRAEFPPAADWINAYADYLEKGGTFTVKLDPPRPIDRALTEEYGPNPEPEVLVELLGIEVTQTAN